MAAAAVTGPAGENILAIDTSEDAMLADGINPLALPGDLPPPPGEGAGTSAPRRTLGGSGRRVGFAGPAQAAEDRTGSSIPSSAVVTVRKLE